MSLDSFQVVLPEAASETGTVDGSERSKPGCAETRSPVRESILTKKDKDGCCTPA